MTQDKSSKTTLHPPRMHCHGAESSLTPYASIPDLVASLRKLALEMVTLNSAGIATVSSLADILESWGNTTVKQAGSDQSLRAQATRTFERLWEGDGEPA